MLQKGKGLEVSDCLFITVQQVLMVQKRMNTEHRPVSS